MRGARGVEGYGVAGACTALAGWCGLHWELVNNAGLGPTGPTGPTAPTQTDSKPASDEVMRALAVRARSVRAAYSCLGLRVPAARQNAGGLPQ